MCSARKTSIPTVIVQTHSSDSINKKHRQTWIDMHPGYEYRFFDDNDCRRFFIDEFPELLGTYEILPLPAQKADLFRYAYIYKHGGVYADADTICHAPIHEYIDLNLEQLIVGIEMTPSIYPHPVADYSQDYHFPFQILQWTFASPPEHPVLKDVINRITYSLQQLGTSDLREYSKHSRFTLELTGPMMFTDVLLGHLSNQEHSGILLLDQEAWGYNRFHQSYQDDQYKISEKVKVEHLFNGSWREPPLNSSLTQKLFKRLRHRVARLTKSSDPAARTGPPRK